MLESLIIAFVSLAIVAIIRQNEIAWDEESARLQDWRNFIAKNPGMMYKAEVIRFPSKTEKSPIIRK